MFIIKHLENVETHKGKKKNPQDPKLIIMNI